MEIATSLQLGRHFIATHDLPPGSLLLSELPVLLNPSITPVDPTQFACISCNVDFNPASAVTCPNCEWFFCSSSCSKSKTHLEAECPVLSKLEIENKCRLMQFPHLIYLRALILKVNDPPTWSKVMELQGSDICTSLDPSDEGESWFASEILPLLGETTLGATTSDILKFKGIFKINGFNPPNGKDGSKEAHSLYLRTSTFSNGCFPNCCKEFGPKSTINVRSTISVQKGDILSIAYNDAVSMMGAVKRQHTGQFGKFICACPRCLDPSELGSMLSGIKCSKCGAGYLLPVDPMNMMMDAPWRCNGATCKGKGSIWNQIDALTEGCKTQTTSFLEGKQIGDVKRIRGLLQSLRSKLHPNHWILLQFERGLIEKIDFSGPNSMPKIDLYLELIEDLLRVLTITSPGLSLPKGQVLGLLFWAITKRLEFKGSQGRGTRELLMERSRVVSEEIKALEEFYPNSSRIL